MQSSFHHQKIELFGNEIFYWTHEICTYAEIRVRTRKHMNRLIMNKFR